MHFATLAHPCASRGDAENAKKILIGQDLQDLQDMNKTPSFRRRPESIVVKLDTGLHLDHL